MEINEGDRLTATKSGEPTIVGTAVLSPLGDGRWYLDGPGRHVEDVEADGYKITIR